MLTRVSHFRVWALCGLYVAAADLPILKAAWESASPPKPNLLAVNLALAAVPVLISFMDGTIQKFRQQKAEGQDDPDSTSNNVADSTGVSRGYQPTSAPANPKPPSSGSAGKPPAPIRIDLTTPSDTAG